MKDEEILIAKQKAMSRFPYYGPILARSRVHENTKIDTMSINNRLCIEYNPKFFTALNDETKVALVTHEVMHAMSDHHHRWYVHPMKGKISFTLFNVAMDMEINQHLKKDSDFFETNGWLPTKMGYPEGKAFEFYLDLMMSDIEKDRQKNPNPNGQQSQSSNGEESEEGDNGNNESDYKNGSGAFSDCKDERDKAVRSMRLHQDSYEQMKKAIKDALSKTTSNIDANGIEQSDLDAQSELQDVINECKEEMRKNGIGNGHGFTDIVRKIPPKKYDWRKVLRSVITNKKDAITRGRDRMTFTRVNRRMAGMNSDIIFSEKYSQETSVNIVVGIDVSGSMGNLTTEMYSRLKTINSQMTGKNHITVVECDTDITNVMIDFEPYQNEVKSTAGGGTDMEAIPRWVDKMVTEKKIEEPDLIVIMTDNYVYWSDKGHPKYAKKTVVLSDNVVEKCPYKQYEVIID